MAAVAGNRVEKVALLLGERWSELLGEQQIGESDDAVERRAELVRDVGEKLILRLHRGIEVGIQLLEALGGLADFDRQAARILVRRATLARDREIRSRLLEGGAFIGVERGTGNDAQHADELRPGP